MKPANAALCAFLLSSVTSACSEEPLYFVTSDTEEGRDDASTDADLAGDTTPDTADSPDTSDIADTADSTETSDTADVADATDTTEAPDTIDAADSTDTGGDFCTSEADFAIVTSGDLDPFEEGNQTVTGYAQDCGLGCLVDADPRACSVDCIVADTGVSEDCAGCYGDTVACSIQNCLASCAADPSSVACEECQAENCLDSFYACTGLDPS